MRLLRTDGTLMFVEYADERQAPRYGILSHRWQNGEVSYGDIISGLPLEGANFPKLQQFCVQCACDGLSLAWIDTCCINKDSSAELSEAINSMYRWYQSAFKCYVYLSDVVAPDSARTSAKVSIAFARSEWFERGWTLQELIAPSNLYFYDRDWCEIGTKQELSDEISGITRIPIDVLHGEDPKNYCIAQRMSWAARRKTTRIEDQAYSLMGLFDVNMPMLYGEGEKAFIRLQEEIIRYSADQSIFVWPGLISRYDTAEMYDVTYRRLEGLLATSPAAFVLCGNIIWEPGVHTQRPFSVTNLGLSMELLLRQCSMDVYQAKLNCFVNSDSGRASVAIFLRQTDRDGQFVRYIHDGALTKVWEDGTQEERDVRVNVIQGQKLLSKPSRHMVMFLKGGQFSVTPTHFGAPTFLEYNSITTAVPLGNYGKCIALIAASAGPRGCYTMSVDFRFDFHFNPYFQVAFETGNAVPQQGIQYAIPPDSSSEYTWNSTLRRPMFVEQSLEEDGTRWMFSGHRSEGLCVWLTNLNVFINVQRRAFLHDQIWTIEAQKAVILDPHFLSYGEDRRNVLFSGKPPRLSARMLVAKEMLGYLRARDQEDPAPSDKCPICFELLISPIATGCEHMFCQACMRWADLSVASTQLASIPLDSESDDKHILCPLCGDVTDAASDSDCQQRIQSKYPTTYRLFSWCLPDLQQDKFPLFENLTLTIGNTHRMTRITAPEMIHRNRHDWTFFLRPSKPDLVAEVKVTLHGSFREPEITLTSPPFEIRRFGWGVFNVRVNVILRSGYEFIHVQAVLDDQLRSSLELTWLLDFEGDGGKGWLKVAVERKKPKLSENDLKLRDQITRLRMLQRSH